MRKSIITIGAVVAVTLSVGAAYALYGTTNDRQVHEFFSGHTHVNGETSGAPSHSGGTDDYGCHNGSVPYHCH